MAQAAPSTELAAVSVARQGRPNDEVLPLYTTTQEDLASEFGLKVVDVIARVQALEMMGYISGVVDDRGKFIYIERGEMEAMAQFIKKKGRVRISALAQESSRLIDLEPKAVEDDEDDEAAEQPATGVDEAR